MRRSFALSAFVTMAALLAACSGSTMSTAPAAPRFTNSVFYKDYVGPQRPAILAASADGMFLTASQNIVLTARMSGPIFTGGPNFYVWGFDRGGAVNTVAPFPDEPNVKFNAVVVVTADPANGTNLTGIVNLLDGSTPKSVTSAVLLAPDTMQIVVAASLLPSTGFAPPAYTWNLWPRNALGGAPSAQIASFIPDNQMATLMPQ